MEYKYNKYKLKYESLKKQLGGANCLRFGYQQHSGECWHDALSMLMLQSDGLKDIFISQLEIMNIEEVHAHLVSLFLPENINQNAYLLPFEIYMFYLKHIDEPAKINYLINEFLRLSKEYIQNHKERALNRLRYDEELARYPKREYSYDMFDDLDTHLEALRRETTPEGRTTRRRRMSVHVTNTCTQIIKHILSLIEDDEIRVKSFTVMKTSGSNSYGEILAMEILNMYIIRSKRGFQHLYIDTVLFSIYGNYMGYINKKLLLRFFNENLIGLIIGGNVKQDHITIGGHAFSLYKCDGVELLYDDNAHGLIPLQWYEYVHNYIRASDDYDELRTLTYLINSPRLYEDRTIVLDDMLFVRKKVYFGATDIDREVDLILNKLNVFSSEIQLNLLYRRLFELTESTIDNFHIQLENYIENIPSTSLFDKTTFIKNGLKILNNNEPLTQDIKTRTTRLLIDKSDIIIKRN